MLESPQRIIEWQPITGCSYASPGCTNCKTMTLAGPKLSAEFRRDGLISDSKAGPVWNGKLRFSEKRLMLPIERREPCTFAVNPHGDLFHESAPQAWIDATFETMELCPEHRFQVLTKRAARQCAYIRARYDGQTAPSHIALGVSCERQAEADERIPLLIETPAVTRFVTLYPVLGPINLRPFLATGAIAMVLAGEESERPADPRWMRAIAEQCREAGVRFLNSSHLVGETEGVG
jgi:protein gp37